MSVFQNIRRNFWVRLMTILGFGGAAAYCVPSCQKPGAESEEQPAGNAPAAAGSAVDERDAAAGENAPTEEAAGVGEAVGNDNTAEEENKQAEDNNKVETETVIVEPELKDEASGESEPEADVKKDEKQKKARPERKQKKRIKAAPVKQPNKYGGPLRFKGGDF